MRTMWLLPFLCAACAAPSAKPAAEPLAAAEAVRTIDACVIDDAADPADMGVVRAALAELSDDYFRNVGIRFKVTAETRAPFHPSGWPMDIAFFAQNVCPPDAELRFIFTNRFVAPKDASMTAQGEGGQMAGDSHPYYGFVVVYSAEERWKAKNAGGGRALVSTLTHEVGHVFGLDDDHADKTSFMYFASNASLGRWTPDAIARIRKAKWKHWWPHA